MSVKNEQGFPIQRDLTVWQSQTYAPVWVFRKDDGNEFVTTGYTAEMEVRPESDSVTLTASYTTANGRLAVGQAVGGWLEAVVLSLGPADTQASVLAAGVYRYDLWLISAGGDRYPMSWGDFAVVDAVTAYP